MKKNKSLTIHSTVFFNLHNTTRSSTMEDKYIYKNNVYTFFFINDIGKYISIQGLATKSRVFNLNNRKHYIGLGKRLMFHTKISSEYTIFQMPIYLPGLYI